jgi:hypothetical protein
MARQNVSIFERITSWQQVRAAQVNSADQPLRQSKYRQPPGRVIFSLSMTCI